MDVMETADQYLTAELQERRFTGTQRILHFAKIVAMGVFGDQPAMFELVVTRRDSGSEVLRTVADIATPEFLLAQVESDLRTMTVAEFIAEWRLPTG